MSFVKKASNKLVNFIKHAPENFIRFERQVLSITRMNLQSVIERSGASIVIIVGIAGSVAVMVSLLAMGEGLSSTISNTGQEDRVIILRDGSNSRT